MSNTNKRMWATPWGYKESVTIIIGLILVGFMLQFLLGSFNFFLLASPINYIIGGIIILLVFGLSFFRKNIWYQWFTGVPFSVSLIIALLGFAMIMGLVPQVIRLSPHDHSFTSFLGFRQVTSMWPFVIIYLVFLLSLGLLIARRLWNFNKKDYAFYLNHLGLWLFFFGAGLGSADMQRYVMHVMEGDTEWRVYSDDKDVKELEIAIKLHDFYMEEYPPKLTVINKYTGEITTGNKKEFFSIDDKMPQGKVGDWNFTLNQYFHEAVRTSDSTYREVKMPGASPAANITVANAKTGDKHTGWVCGGNSAQIYMTLDLDSLHTVVMTQPEPKRFVSYIDVITKDHGEYKDVALEVNKPFKVGDWVIYQYGYDNEMGKMSSYSSFELIYDPWIYPVYIGMLLIALGSLAFVVFGTNKKK